MPSVALALALLPGPASTQVPSRAQGELPAEVPDLSSLTDGELRAAWLAALAAPGRPASARREERCLPELRLELRNVDGRAFPLRRGGDYRGGRLARYRPELVAAEERPYVHATHFREGATFEGTPESRAGAVFREGFVALPSLADALDAPGRSAAERARLLAVLFGISGLVAPRLERGALGVYRFGGCALGTTGSVGSGTSGADLDPRAQEPLLERWLALRPWLGDR